MKDVVKHVKEEAHGKLIEVFDCAEVFENEECRTARLRQRQILGSHLVYFLHDDVHFFDLSDIRGLT